MGTARRRMRDEIVNSLARLLEQPEVFLLMATHPTQYAHPEALVETDWLEKHLNDEGVRIVESNEDILLYDTGHIPGAIHRLARRFTGPGDSRLHFARKICAALQS